MTPKTFEEIQAALKAKLITPAQAEKLFLGEQAEWQTKDECGQCGGLHKTADCHYVKCSACQTTLVLRIADPCLPCVKARAKAAGTHRCTCPKKFKRPRIVATAGRRRVACDRCLGSIRQVN